MPPDSLHIELGAGTLAGRTPAGCARALVRCAVRVLAVVVCAVVGVVVVWVGSASAAVSHEFLPGPSKKISEGVPVASGAALPGPLSEVGGLVVDSGRLWVADSLASAPFGSRVDAFDAASGVFSLPQLNEEGGVSLLGTGGVAAGHVAGEQEVYAGASEEGKGVVAVYGAAGKLQEAWSGASTPNKSFVENEEGERVGVLRGVAVDNSTGLETSSDVYVTTTGPPAFNVVDVFRPVVGGKEPPGEDVKQILGTCETPGTSCSGGEVVPFSSPSGVAVSGFNGDVFVTDSSSVVDVFEPTVLGEYKFVRQLTGTPTGPSGAEVPFSQFVTGVAADGTDGDIYVVDRIAGAVDEFDSTGEYLGRLTRTPAGPFSSLRSVAVDPASEHVFVRDLTTNVETPVEPVNVFGANIVVPDVTTSAASGVAVSADGQIEAVLNGTVNPDGQGEASCQFAWGRTAAFEQPPAACEPEGVPDGEAKVPVHATIKGLAADTSYVFRLQASNGKGTNPGEENQNETLITPGPGVHGASVSDVSAGSATLQASIDPHGAPTSYYFQYGKSSAYETTVPAAPGTSLGSGKEDALASQRVQGLAAGTLYHYRVVAVSELEVEGTLQQVLFPSADQTFTTQAPSGGSALPDGRAWEQLSPIDKQGAFLQPLTAAGLIQASASGDAISYIGSVPTEEAAQGNTNGVQVLSQRGPVGWSSRDISLSHATASGASGDGGDYRFFSEDLSLALVEPLSVDFASLLPESSPPDSDRTPYIRHNVTCAAVPASCFEPLLTSAPGFADVPEGTDFGGGTGIRGHSEYVGATPDLSHVVISSPVALTSTPISAPQLYEWTAGKPASEALQVISVLPGAKGEPATKSAWLGGLGNQNGSNARNAISDDGSRIVWMEGQGGGHLYLRDTAKGGRTLKLDAPEAQCFLEGTCGSGEVNPTFLTASKDGSRVFFTDPQRLTAGSAALPGRPDLYVCEVTEAAGELGCRLSDLTPSFSGEAAYVQGGVLGTSDDGTWVYFVADGVLGEGATPGHCEAELNEQPAGVTCNLYVSHFDGTTWEAPKLVAVISGDDSSDWPGELPKLTARVSPDGRWVAFMSDRGLTGYDTHDAVSGRLDEEVYLYHADTTGAGRLVCGSCNPTGARPVGVEYAKLDNKLVGGNIVWPHHQWIASNVPGWTPFLLQQARHQSRYLSDQGRLFFNSSDALVPRDVNNNEDVYEFEPVGVGSCSASAPGFSVVTGGCVGLVSSGRAVGESAFIDASETGEDVFFLTGEQLVGSDSDSALDVYDAHVCSASVPCLGVSSVPPSCTTADGCRTAPSQQPSLFGSPASANFSGAGNLTPPPPVSPKRKSAAQVRAEKLKKALKVCRAKHSRRKRVVCEAVARRRYGVITKRASNHRRPR